MARESVSAASSSEDRASQRLERLAEAVRGLGRRSWLQPEAVQRALLVLGSVLMPLGLVLILLGWYGAAHTGRLFEQIPYAISGGLLGGAIVVAGGFCYFGYWLTRLVMDNRRHTAQLLAAIDRLEARLTALPAAGGNGGPNGEMARLGAAAPSTRRHRRPATASTTEG